MKEVNLWIDFKRIRPEFSDTTLEVCIVLEANAIPELFIGTWKVACYSHIRSPELSATIPSEY